MTEAPPPSNLPARPRDSASLMVLREGADGIEVLMGKRGSKAVFNDVYVFPGGKVDASDRHVDHASPLDSDILDRMSRNRRRARAFANAAIRETYEEAGLLLADAGDPGASRNPSYRSMREIGVAPALARLQYVGHAITPSTRPRRFNARFFLAWATEMSGELAGSGELSDLAYVSLTEAQTLPTVDVTRFMLREIQRREAEGFKRPDAYPFFTYRSGRRYCRYE
ncbi:MAG: NUDIX domain-containing protein [Rhodospirillaceae bacterium]|nr:NUDIX domain-containing protein [Rhodospirillaceae bacterium]MBT6136111.1 NUDIX domain-containing protein [Rhodospirillaceae bacterium]